MFVVGYSGNLGRVHAVEALIELIALLEDEPGCRSCSSAPVSAIAAARAIVGDRGLEN